jgi:hypothetical protein
MPLILIMSMQRPASAYRPFDGTDAAVADPGVLEIEFQPAGIRRNDEQTTLIAPATVFNYGFAKNWEAVLEGEIQTPRTPSGPTSLSASAAFLKHVLRPGVLQDQLGPSIATEFGVLLPDTIGNTGVGAHLAGIASQRWDWGTVTLNIVGELTRDQHADVFSGIILEGPATWPIRPVAEFFYENEIGQEWAVSGLIGAIWQIQDNLSFDIGFRHAIVSRSIINEVRAGFTIGIPLQPMSGPTHK